MDDLQLLETTQRIHDNNVRLHEEFMQQSSAEKITANASDAELEKLEKEFQLWMEYIENKKLC